MKFFTRFLEPPEHSFFLFGPRGTGKTHWTRRLLPGALFVDLLDPVQQRRYLARPESLEQLIASRPGCTDVVIDEIQSCPKLLDVVHRLIERGQGPRFVLTGSSARKIRRADVNLLAGRALRCTMHPFMAAELGDRFDLVRALEVGLVPLVVAAEQPDEVVRHYVDLYVQAEVRAEGLVRRLDDFARFLEAISFSHGSVLNVANVARECEVGRQTVESYIIILEDLLLAVRLPVFSRRAARALISHPKLYLFDCGVFRSLRPRGPLDRAEEISGVALEGLVFQHLRAWNAYRGDRNRLYFWRTRGGSEVDFVVYGEDGLFAIEVKNAEHVHGKDLRALKSFARDYPECRAALLHRGRERLRVDDILCLPCEEFLRELVPSENLPI